MRFELLLLAALPSAMAATAYTAPASLKTMVDADDSCELPESFHVQNFAAKSNSSGEALSAYRFTFVDATSNTTSLCQYNATSVSTTPGGQTPRYACEDRDVKFIWRDQQKDLTLIQRVCPGSDGIPDYEVSGTVPIFLACAPGGSGQCTTNSTDYNAMYTSLSPVRDPTAMSS